MNARFAPWTVVVVGVALWGTACAVEPVGSCDPDSARRVVYTEDGEPAFEGQALMIASCGGGGFCHSDAALGEARLGAPVGLDYDVRLAATSAEPEVEEALRLRRDLSRALSDRESIWFQVNRMLMPPGGEANASFLDAAPVYEHRNLRTGQRRPVLPLTDPAAREVLRNWLACDLPVVERTVPMRLLEDGEEELSAVGFTVESQEEPLEPRWSDIYPRYIARRCASGACHDADSPAAELDLSTSESALANLLAQDAFTGANAECSDAGSLLEAGNPEGSLLFHKLRGTDADGARVCGTRMPQSGGGLSAQSLAAIEAWITAGAMP
ncbi:MAG: hypothetical protein AB8I08_25730 [Sandaracinaceae bacterium]